MGLRLGIGLGRVFLGRDFATASCRGVRISVWGN